MSRKHGQTGVAAQVVLHLLTTDEAAEYLRLSPSFLHKARVQGRGPKFVKIGKKILYRQRDLDDWVEGRVRQSTSESVAI